MYDIAQLDLPPLRRAAGTVRLPGSKSISNRVLLLAGLSRGRTDIHDLLDSDDTQVMLEALRRLGCDIETPAVHQRRRHRPPAPPTAPLSLFLGNAGTAMRPLAAALALLVTRDGGDIELAGVARMHERPIGDLVDALRQLGAHVDYLRHEGFPPLRLRGAAGGTLHTAQPIRVRGDVSSQFLTALLLALPLASGEQPIVVEVDGELISKPYVEITLALLQRFGIVVQHDGLRPSRPAALPGAWHRRGDASSAYFVAAGALAAVELLRIEKLGRDSIRATSASSAAQAMGARRGRPGWIEAAGAGRCKR
jgi:3-phosphoshikimate 1-carboxyvinyltransferase